MQAQRGIPLQVTLDGFYGGRGKEMGLLEIYRAAYWLKEPGLLRMYDGVAELIVALEQRGVAIGILTSKARDIVVEGHASGAVVELAELGLGALAEHAVGCEDVRNAKPHPEGLRLLMSRLGALARDTLVVGDSHTDILAAQAAGCWTCLAGWGVPAEERDFTAAMPDVVAEHPSALRDLLAPGA